MGLPGLIWEGRPIMGKDFFVHPTSVIDDDVAIGKDTKIWYFCHVQSGARIGKNCSLGQNVNIGNNAIIGDGCRVQNNVSIYEGIKLGNNVFCGPSMVFTNDPFPRADDIKGKDHWKETIVEDGASICANATIVCGHSLGKRSMVAAGAVVTRDVPDHALVAGVPARRIGWVCDCGTKLDDQLRCSFCGKAFVKYEKGLKEL